MRYNTVQCGAVRGFAVHDVGYFFVNKIILIHNENVKYCSISRKE